ncbi:MAG: carbohydrate-binding domain-containing protein, partial [Lachnospiraceae bacterium]
MDKFIRKVRKTKIISVIAVAIFLMTTVLMTGCNNSSSGSNGTGDSKGIENSIGTTASNGGVTSGGTLASDSGSTLAGVVSLVEIEDMFTSRDKEVGYDESSSVLIELNGDSIKSSSDTVQIDGTSAVISEEGTYIISGTLSDGMIIVNADDSAKIQLVLDNANISSSTSAAIYVRSADKVFITLAANSENTLANGGEYVAIDDNNIDAVIFSKEDLTLNGTGSLSINAAAGHGIVSKDDLVVTGGTYKITAEKHGFSANDSIRIADGNFTIVSGKDGLHSENEDDT